VQEVFYNNTDYTTVTDLTTTNPSVIEGLGVLEQWLGARGGGLIHATRFGAAILANEHYVVHEDDYTLVTRQGTPIVNGAGYLNVDPDSNQATSGFWMMATSGMTAFRSPIEYNEGYDLPTNKQTGIAERAWSVILDCDEVAAFHVTGL
jgi:hypothetical protein